MADQTTAQHSRDESQAEALMRQQIRLVSQPLKATAGWMTFLAIALVVVAALPIIATASAPDRMEMDGISWAWVLVFAALPIWCGALLHSAGRAARAAADSGLDTDLLKARGKLSRLIKITGTWAAIVVGLVAVMAWTALSTLPNP